MEAKSVQSLSLPKDKFAALQEGEPTTGSSRRNSLTLGRVSVRLAIWPLAAAWASCLAAQPPDPVDAMLQRGIEARLRGDLTTACNLYLTAFEANKLKQSWAAANASLNLATVASSCSSAPQLNPIDLSQYAIEHGSVSDRSMALNNLAILYRDRGDFANGPQSA